MAKIVITIEDTPDDQSTPINVCLESDIPIHHRAPEKNTPAQQVALVMMNAAIKQSSAARLNEVR